MSNRPHIQEWESTLRQFNCGSNNLPLLASKRTMPFAIYFKGSAPLKMVLKSRAHYRLSLEIRTYDKKHSFFGRKYLSKDIPLHIEKGQASLPKDFAIYYHTKVDRNKCAPKFVLEFNVLELSERHCVVAEEFLGTCLIESSQTQKGVAHLHRGRTDQVESLQSYPLAGVDLLYQLELGLDLNLLSKVLPDFVFACSNQAVIGLPYEQIGVRNKLAIAREKKFSASVEFALSPTISKTLQLVVQKQRTVTLNKLAVKLAKINFLSYSVAIFYHNGVLCRRVAASELFAEKGKQEAAVEIVHADGLTFQVLEGGGAVIVAVLALYELVANGTTSVVQVMAGVLPLSPKVGSQSVQQVMMRGPLSYAGLRLAALKKEEKVHCTIELNQEEWRQTLQAESKQNQSRTEQALNESKLQFEQKARLLEEQRRRSEESIRQYELTRERLQHELEQKLRQKEQRFIREMQSISREKVQQEQQIFQMKEKLDMLTALLQTEKKKKIQVIEEREYKPAGKADDPPLIKITPPTRMLPLLYEQGLLEKKPRPSELAQAKISHLRVTVKVCSLRELTRPCKVVVLRVRFFDRRAATGEPMSVIPQEKGFFTLEGQQSHSPHKAVFKVELPTLGSKRSFMKYLAEGSAMVEVQDKESLLLVGVAHIPLSELLSKEHGSSERRISAAEADILTRGKINGVLQVVLESSPLEEEVKPLEEIVYQRVDQVVSPQPLRAELLADPVLSKQQEKILRVKMLRQGQRAVDRDQLNRVAQYREANKKNQVKQVISSLLSQFRSLRVQSGKAELIYFQFTNLEPRSSVFKVSIDDDRRRLVLLTKGPELKAALDALKIRGARTVDQKGTVELSPNEAVTFLFKFQSHQWFGAQHQLQHLFNIYVQAEHTGVTVNGYSVKVVESGLCPSKKLCYYERPEEFVSIRLPPLFIHELPPRPPTLVPTKPEVEVEWANDYEAEIKLETGNPLSSCSFFLLVYSDQHRLQLQDVFQIEVRAYQEVLVPASRKPFRFQLILKHSGRHLVRLFASTSQFCFRKQQAGRFALGENELTLISVECLGQVTTKQLVHCVSESGTLLGGWIITPVPTDLLS